MNDYEVNEMLRKYDYVTTIDNKLYTVIYNPKTDKKNIYYINIQTLKHFGIDVISNEEFFDDDTIINLTDVYLKFTELFNNNDELIKYILENIEPENGEIITQSYGEYYKYNNKVEILI